MEEAAQNVSKTHQDLSQIKSEIYKMLEDKEKAEKQKGPQEHEAVRLQVRSELDKMLNLDVQNMTKLEAENDSGTDDFEDAPLCYKDEDACICKKDDFIRFKDAYCQNILDQKSVDDQMELLNQELSNYKHAIEAAERERKQLETRLIQARNENQNPLFNTTSPLNDKVWKQYMDELNKQVIIYDPTGSMIREPKDCDLEGEKEKYAAFNRCFSDTYPHLGHQSISSRTLCGQRVHIIDDHIIDNVHPESVYPESDHPYSMEELKQVYKHQKKIENELRQKIERITRELRDKESQQVEEQIVRDQEKLKMKQNIAEMETNILEVDSNIQNYCVDIHMRNQILEFHKNVRRDMCSEVHEVKANIKAKENKIRELCEALETCKNHQCQIQENMDCLKKLIGRGRDILDTLKKATKPLDDEIQALLFKMATLQRMKCKLDKNQRTAQNYDC